MQPEAKQEVFSTGVYDYTDERAGQRRLRRALRSAGEAVSENQWLLPVAGSVIGVLLALVLGLAGSDPDPEKWALTVGGIRSGLISALSIIFAGLSIVLALASVTIQNVVVRFSLRLLRIYLRNPWDKVVIAVFAMSATFIMAEFFRLRALPFDAPAPVGGVLIGAILLFLSSAIIVWHISALASWFRVDRTVRRMARLILNAARSVEKKRQGFSPAPASSFEPPAHAISIPAYRSGYLTDVDTQGLLDLAVHYDLVFVITRCEGCSVVRGETIGWMAAGEGANVEQGLGDQIADVIDITQERELGEDIGYGIFVVVDIAIRALSPGINDPNTAVQVIEDMTSLFSLLAQVRLGPVGHSEEGGRQRVAVRALTFGDYVEMATAQIVLYSRGDPMVIKALQRLARVLEGLDLSESDREAVDTFAVQVRGLA
jgi:uncharacterized membrane protein